MGLGNNAHDNILHRVLHVQQ